MFPPGENRPSKSAMRTSPLLISPPRRLRAVRRATVAPRPDRPRLPTCRQLLDLLGHRRRQVVQLGAVGLHVVQLPRPAGALATSFHFAVADRPVALVLPEDRVAARAACPRTPARRLMPSERRIVCRPARGYVAPARSTQVAIRSIRWPGLAIAARRFARDAGRPVGDQRRADAAFVDPVLVLAERRVDDVRPALGRRRRRCRPARASRSAPGGPGSRRASAAGRSPSGSASGVIGGSVGLSGRGPSRRSFVAGCGPSPRRSRRCPAGTGSACCRAARSASARRRACRCPGPCGRPSPRRPPCTRPPTPCPPPRPSPRPAGVMPCFGSISPSFAAFSNRALRIGS